MSDNSRDRNFAPIDSRFSDTEPSEDEHEDEPSALAAQADSAQGLDTSSAATDHPTIRYPPPVTCETESEGHESDEQVPAVGGEDNSLAETEQSDISYELDNHPATMSNGFQTIESRAEDDVLAIHFNDKGKRWVIGSADHRIQVFDKDENEKWKITDIWRAHHGAVYDVKWNGSAMGQIFGSIGDDMELKIWQEDPSQAKLSGRRFTCIYAQSSGNSVVYSCLDFINIRYDTYLAVITRDGLLSLMEPVEQTEFDDWKDLDQIIVCGDYIARGVETQFRVSFQKTPQPNWAAVKAGVDKKALSLAVTAMDKVYVYRIERTGDSRDGSYKFQAPVAALTGADGLFRDVAWSNAFFLPIDRIVTAADDGYVRIYELKTQDETNARSQDITKTGQGGESSTTAAARPSSGIGAGLAGPSSSPGYAGVPHVWKVLSKLKHEGVWRVVWQPYSNCVYSTGDDGKVRLWDLDAETWQWIERAEISPE